MLNAIIVDGEPVCADMLSSICAYGKGLNTKKFYSPSKALTYAKTSSVHLAFLDAGHGSRLGVGLKKINPATFVIFSSRATFRKSYVSDIFCSGCADAFITKPYDFAQINYTIDMAVKICSASKNHDVSITMFGDFNIYSDGTPVRFSNAKAKELLAVCADAKGTVVNMYDCMRMLWPGREHTSRLKCLYRKAVCGVKNTLREYGITGMFENFHGSCRVNPESFRCDYYDYLKSADKSKYFGSGIYLRGYPWADNRAGEILFDIMHEKFFIY